MTVNCDRCCVYIEDDNRRWPGYCSSTCRDRDRSDRDRLAADRAQRRRDATQQRDHLARRNHLT